MEHRRARHPPILSFPFRSCHRDLRLPLIMSDTLPAFVDIEASGLSDNGYPVEIGLALPSPLEAGNWEIRLLSWLVQPAPQWLEDQDAWCTTAEQIHGLKLDQLQAAGLAPADVARELDQALFGRTMVADTGPEGMDAFWLGRLADAAGQPWSSRRWPLSGMKSGDWIAAAAQRTGISRMRVAMIIQTAPEVTHAAAEDALREAWMWCDAMSARVPKRTISAASSYRPRWPAP